MSTLSEPTKAVFFLSLLYKDEGLLENEVLNSFQIYQYMEPKFNPLIDYYTKEMGEGLKRKIVVTKELESRELLINKKLWAHDIEQKTLVEGKRQLNIDVGFISLEQMVLATGKPYAHRVYLRSGIYADLNYIYQNKSFQTLPWTYPDYADQEKIDWFNDMRKSLLY